MGQTITMGKKSQQQESSAPELARTHNAIAPWSIVRADDEQLARLNIIKDLLSRLHYTGKDKRLIHPDPKIVFAYDVSNRKNGPLSK